MRRNKRERIEADVVTAYADAAHGIDVIEDGPPTLADPTQASPPDITPSLADELVARAEQSRTNAVGSGLVYIGDAILALCERIAERE